MVVADVVWMMPPPPSPPLLLPRSLSSLELIARVGWENEGGRSAVVAEGMGPMPRFFMHTRCTYHTISVEVC